MVSEIHGTKINPKSSLKNYGVQNTWGRKLREQMRYLLFLNLLHSLMVLKRGYIYIYMCVCVCVCDWLPDQHSVHTHHRSRICRQTPTTHITSTFEPLYVISVKYRLSLPDDGSYVIQSTEYF